MKDYQSDLSLQYNAITNRISSLMEISQDKYVKDFMNDLLSRFDNYQKTYMTYFNSHYIEYLHRDRYYGVQYGDKKFRYFKSYTEEVSKEEVPLNEKVFFYSSGMVLKK